MFTYLDKHIFLIMNITVKLVYVWMHIDLCIDVHDCIEMYMCHYPVSYSWHMVFFANGQLVVLLLIVYRVFAANFAESHGTFTYHTHPHTNTHIYMCVCVI